MASNDITQSPDPNDPHETGQPPFEASLELGAAETIALPAGEEVVEILEAYLKRLQAGEAPDHDALLKQHPEFREQLASCLAGLDFIHGRPAAEPTASQLGDFAITREVGRGGMGAVYEATQLSLGRRVALKVLRFAGVSDPQAIERFQREAETVAALHHTNIVPVFYVGNERGVNYYAMQFIEGENLAQVLADPNREISIDEVTSWGVQAAEALAHAHARGVIHRDVKPSNLILDSEGRLWLTDFGLARRTDDVTLSLSGMLLGTPRYMSPEQARAKANAVDHRSDLFSLGATLYELLTGEPAFPGDVPHDVIQHILIDEPQAIRTLRPEVPRDLETIVMKCLAKGPERRYHSAQELVQDLRAFSEGRPIAARRTSLVELAAKWVQRNRHSLSQAATAVAATILIMVTGLAVWFGYHSWNQSSLRLAADGADRFIDLINSNGDVLMTTGLPMREATLLPSDDYRIVVAAPETFSQTIGMDLLREQHDIRYDVNVSDQWLIAPFQCGPFLDAVELDETTAAVVSWTQEGISTYHPGVARSNWSLKMVGDQSSTVLTQYPGYQHPSMLNHFDISWSSEIERYHPWTVSLSEDLDGDDVWDFVVAARHQAWLMAISGNGKGILWFASRDESLLQEAPNTAGVGRNGIVWNYQAESGAITSKPLVVEDLNNDGFSDMVFTAMHRIDKASPGVAIIPPHVLPAEQWAEAISGRTGETLWRTDLPIDAGAFGGPAPQSLRWIPTTQGKVREAGATFHFGDTSVRTPPQLLAGEPYLVLPSNLDFINTPNGRRLVTVYTNQCLMINPATGHEEVIPLSLPGVVGRELQWRDVDGDRLPECIGITTTAPSVPGNNSLAKVHVFAWSIAKKSVLWVKELDTVEPVQRLTNRPAPHWPLVADLDGDELPEVVVPDHRSNKPTSGQLIGDRTVPYAAVAVLNGATGEARWNRKLTSIDAIIEHFVTGPDIDQDGTRDLLVATISSRKGSHGLYVDALSGATGESIWFNSLAPQLGAWQSTDYTIGWIKCWHAGTDGWPTLLVNVTTSQSPGAFQLADDSQVIGFSCGTGEVATIGHQVEQAIPTDLDGDGVEELIVMDQLTSATTSSIAVGVSDPNHKAHVVRGIACQPWKRLGDFGVPVTDLNQDGVRDFINSWGDGTIVARDGTSGKQLWRNRPVRATYDLQIVEERLTQREPVSHDFNRDGYNDLVVIEKHLSNQVKSLLHAVSGKDGTLLWSLDSVTAKEILGTLDCQVVDLNGDNSAELIWTAAIQPADSTIVTSPPPAELLAFRVKASNGQLEWSTTLKDLSVQASGTLSGLNYSVSGLAIEVGDLNDDGCKDLLLPGINDQGEIELVALNGNDGSRMWSRQRQPDGLGADVLRNWTTPTVCDFENDGTAEVVVIEPSSSVNAVGVTESRVTLSVLRGTDGYELRRIPTSCVFTHFSSYSSRGSQLLSPEIVRLADGGQRALVWLPEDRPRIISLDATGIVEELVLSGRNNQQGVFNGTGEQGNQELAFYIDQDQLIAITGRSISEPLWTSHLQDAYSYSILDVRASNENEPAHVIVSHQSPGNRVSAYDVENGKLLWTCAGPIPRSEDLSSYQIPNRVALLGRTSKDENPLVSWTTGFLTTCRQAVPIDHDPHVKDEPSTLSTPWRGVSSATADAITPRTDKRWKRRLPWSMHTEELPGDLLTLIAAGAWLSLTIILLPALYVIRVVLRRKVSLRMLLLVPAVSLLAIQSLWFGGFASSVWPTAAERLFGAGMFLPVLPALSLLGWWIATRRWRALVIMCGVLVVVASLMAVLVLWQDQRLFPMHELESYHWEGWYGIFFPAAYGTAWGMLVMLGANPFVRWLRRSRLRERSNATAI